MRFAIIDDLVSDSIMCYKALMNASKEYFKDVVIDSYSHLKNINIPRRNIMLFFWILI